MKITGIKKEGGIHGLRISALVRWEDCQRDDQYIYFEADSAFVEDLACNPDAFLAAAIVPAFWSGERRLSIEGEVCPELCENLQVALSALQHWFKPAQALTKIEAKARSSVSNLLIPRRAGCFFSGGIDSLAALRANQLAFPREHPGSIKDGLLIFGLEVEKPEAFKHVLALMSAIAEAAGVTLIPISTNVRELNDNWGFWYTAYMGAGLCAIPHVFSRRLATVTIASDYDVPHLKPHGSHPLMEPNFSSYELKIRYDGISMSRLKKTKLVASWDVALQNLRVCNREQYYRPGQLNCGECEKCVRTMLALLAVGALHKTNAFPCADVSAELVLNRVHLSQGIIPFYEELLTPLAENGRPDLVRAVQYVFDRFHGEVGYRGPIKRFDRKYLSGTVMRLKRAVLNSG
jgi:hypothetical protein